MSTIPGSKAQDRQRLIEHRLRAGNALLDQVINGKIIDVFDEEWAEKKQKVLPSVASAISRYPGQVVFLIELESGQQVALPSRNSQEELEAMYGNKPLLIGRSVQVHYKNRSITDGWFSFLNERTTRRMDMRETSKVPDIGGIL